MGIFYESDDPNEQVDPPVQAIHPGQFSIDPETTRFAPLEYSGMLAQGMANWVDQDLIPAYNNTVEYWRQKTLPGGEQAPSQYQVKEGPQAYLQPEVDTDFPTASPKEMTPDDLMSPESKPLITSIESGYADKALMKPYQSIRESLAAGDYDAVGKAHGKLVAALTKNMGPLDRFVDIMSHGGRISLAHKIAADIVMNELKASHGRALEATQAGLLHPSELLPEQRGADQPVYQNLIPAEGMPMTSGFDTENPGMPMDSQVQPSLIPAQPGQGYGITVPGDVDPMARLTPIQEDIVDYRTKANMYPQRQKGQGTKAEHYTPSDIAMKHVQIKMDALKEKLGRDLTNEEQASIYDTVTGAERKDQEEARKQKATEADTLVKQARARLLDAMPARVKKQIELMDIQGDNLEAKTKLSEAMADWYKQLPEHQKRLQAMKDSNHPQHYVFQAIQRVKEAIDKGVVPDPVDSALYKSFLTKGQPGFRSTIDGDIFDAYTGQKVVPEELKGAKKTGLGQVLKNMFGRLFGGGDTEDQVEAIDENAKGTQANPHTPKTPEEAAKLPKGSYYMRPDTKQLIQVK